ncbi:MAG: hypothetical protein QME92_00290 [Bacillota bacterium]|nr:hypothetical protein [Bacillota bacterium]
MRRVSAIIALLAIIAVVAAGRVMYGVVEHDDGDDHITWTGVIDRVESGMAVVVPLATTPGDGMPGMEQPWSEVVMPTALLPTRSDEGSVVDLTATLRPRKTHARKGRIRALVLELSSQGR